MSRVKTVNPNADIIGKNHALAMNIQAAKSLMSVVKSNLGPSGTMKMLVSGAGMIKITKDGKVLLDEMQIQHPTASIIARTATAQDDITGDGTTSNVLFTGELLRQSAIHLSEGLHPRVIVEGFELARDQCMKFVDEFKTTVDTKEIDTEMLMAVAKSSLRTKVHQKLADHLADIAVRCIKCIRKPDLPIDLHMVELMHMVHKSDMDTRYIDGLVLDHGARHPNMAKRSENCYIMILNVSLEYEKSEVNAGFFYSNAEEREQQIAAERKFTDDKVLKIIKFKEKICGDSGKGFILINQKGIDPLSLDLLQKAGIVGIRRAKRRNMERLSLACGGYAVNSVDDLEEKCLGFADLVYEHVLGEDKYTFVEGCKNAHSCTVLLNGPNDHTIRQIKDALRDGLRAVRNVIEDGAVIPGAGAFEVAAYNMLQEFKRTQKGRVKLGIDAFANALLVVPKTLAENAGLDVQQAIIALMEQSHSEGKPKVGLDLATGKCLMPADLGIWDNVRVKRQLLHLGSLVAMKLLLVDEVIRAGRKFNKAPADPNQPVM
mmetsp:Transcript_19166/g.34245  ORF Transcript_19166/g.34245 Transcript_19166/m.34245 type:complete len:545 (+) Transcript_19166:76-1710(+)|eukprot:CAMPEP_0197525260 /NCGR_PEP_ID=MMETSP1318-20131121/10717_1 /TAXON_ID=552666 /ORGANISM="Partenskyella glossopodia, Strain RCC365" /LENGTH=544 /DNA_ID=CAMNT_0043078461 /DNA_START=39 /DNA_END=1673 /DNA_ORIENTATION=+